MKKLLLIQPGPYGDILVCAPIAKWYADRGYKVYWPITEKFLSMLDRFDYVTPILLSDEVLHSDWLRSNVMKIIPMMNGYDKILNLADRGPHATAERIGLENFEQCKYRLGKVPFEEKYNLQWTRNRAKEQDLYDSVVGESSPYVFAHVGSSKGAEAKIPDEEFRLVVKAAEVPGYDMVDWYKVITEAEKIYCTESSFQALVDGFYKKTKDRFILAREAGGSFSTISEHWDKKYLI